METIREHRGGSNDQGTVFILFAEMGLRPIARRSAHSAGPSRDLAVAGLFVSFSLFSVLILLVV